MRPPIRFDEMPEMADFERQLTGLFVRDLRVTEVFVDGQSAGFSTSIVLHGFNNHEPMVWVTGVRPTAEDSRQVGIHLVFGLVAAADEARTKWPSTTPVADQRYVEAARRAVDSYFRAFERPARPPAPPTERKPRAPRPEPEVVSDETIAKRYDPADYHRWRTDLRAARTEVGHTQKQVAQQVGGTSRDVSLIERGLIEMPAPAMIRRLSALYELDDPKPAGSY